MSTEFTPSNLTNLEGFAVQKKTVALYEEPTAQTQKASDIWSKLGLSDIKEAISPSEPTDPSFKEVLAGDGQYTCSIKDVKVGQDSSVMNHPVEDGFSVADYKLISPPTVTVQIVLPSSMYESAYKEIKDIFEKSKFIIISTKAQVYRNMILQAMPHNEDVENIDRLVFNLTFREVRRVGYDKENNSDAENNSTLRTIPTLIKKAKSAWEKVSSFF